MLTEILKNSSSTANHIEITLSSILIGVIIIKILLRIIFSTIYENSKEPFVIKNNNPSHIDYEQISNKYFQYFSLLAPKLSKNVNCNKFRHYDLEKKIIFELTIPEIINDKYLNGYNLDYILSHLWMYKNHKKNKIWTTINKFLAYYAYDLFSFWFYILVIIKLIFFLGVEKNLNHEVMLRDIISISLSISSIIIFIFTIFTIIYGVIIKHFWERKYERDTISFVEQNFSEFFEEYMYARKFSKKHKFTIYFKPKLKKVHRNETPININKPDKYLSPFSTVKFRKWKHNQ